MKQTPPHTCRMIISLEKNKFRQRQEDENDNRAEERVGAPLQDLLPTSGTDCTMKQTPPHTCRMIISLEKNKFRPRQEDENDNRAEERVGAPLQDLLPTSGTDCTMKQTPPHTCRMIISLEKNKFRPRQEDENDNRAEERVGAPLQDLLPTSGSLIDGLVDDVVLGKVLTRLPWYQLPVLMTLNRTWADAVTRRFPEYASLHQRILSNSLVIYRNSYLGLWVYSYHRFLWRLPIPEYMHRRVEFVLDDHRDCIFALARRSRQEDGSLIYDVGMLDLSEGSNVCSWKNLPPLRIRFSRNPIECVKYPYSCSSFRTENGICIKLIFRSWSLSIDTDSFSVWTLDGTQKLEWHQWKRESVTASPVIQSITGAEKNTPFYVEIEVNIPLRGTTVKYLYERCEQGKYTPHNRFSQHGFPEYIFMFKNTEKQPTMNFNFYHIEVRDTYTRSQVSFHKAQLNDESKRILHVSEWSDFQHFWRPFASRYHQWEAPGFEGWENNGRSVMKIVSNGYSGRKEINGIRWDKRKFKIGPGRQSMDIKVAQKGHSFYIYHFVAKSS